MSGQSCSLLKGSGEAMNLRDVPMPPPDPEWDKILEQRHQEMKARRESYDKAHPEQADHRQEGVDAFLRGDDIDDCPFDDPESQEALLWRLGWNEAESDEATEDEE